MTRGNEKADKLTKEWDQKIRRRAEITVGGGGGGVENVCADNLQMNIQRVRVCEVRIVENVGK